MLPHRQNPAGRGPNDPGLAGKAEYDAEKQAEFKHYSWIAAKDTQVRMIVGCMHTCRFCFARGRPWILWPAEFGG
jgi:hypothetical protein